MPQSRDLVSEVWREACRHIEITESATAIAATLAPHMPLQGMLVLGVDAAAKSVESLAVGRGPRRVQVADAARRTHVRTMAEARRLAADRRCRGPE